MVQVSNLIFILIWIPLVLYKISVWLYWLQDKEYRFDRFSELLFSKDAFRKLLFNYTLVVFVAVLVVRYIKLYEFWLLITIIILDIKVFFTLLTEGLRRPVLTDRINRISSIIFILTLIPLLFFYYGFLTAFSLFFVTEILFVFSFLIGISWTGQIANKIKTAEKLKAIKILSDFKPYVIGITGSYGKTTTKDFIYHLIVSNYQTLKTEANENTVFGVVRRIMKFLKQTTKYFVVEMGAYKTGEIKEISGLVKPKIGVITGIEEQHLSLFGSLKNILKAKFELIEALPNQGIAIFNYSNSYCVELSKKAQMIDKNLQVYGYAKVFSEPKKYLDNVIQFRIISESESGINFEIYFQNKKVTITTPILGEHFIENLSCAILVANLLDVPWDQIKKSCKTLVLPKGTMNILKLKNRTTIIDDTHNSTPKSFISAISFSKKNPGTKLLITSGIIELGKRHNLVHEQIGKSLKGVFDKVIVTNKEPLQGLKKGFVGDIKFEGNSNKLVYLIKENISKGNCLILFEGRQSKIVMDYINSQK